LDESFTSLYKIIQRNYKLYTKEKKDNFHLNFKKSFEKLCRTLANLSDFATVEDFEKILISPKEIPSSFLSNQDELINFSKIVENLKDLHFSSYDILKLISVLLKYLKNGEKNKKLDAMMQILERLFII